MSTTEQLFGVQGTEQATPENQPTPKPAPNAQVEGTDKATPTPEPGAVEEPQYYSTEELAALELRDIELERVAPESRVIVEKAIKAQKSMEADYTRKTMELAEAKKPQKERTWEDEFDEDPENAIKLFSTQLSVNKKEIKRLRAIGEDEAANDLQDKLDLWQDYKDSLLAKQLGSIKQETKREKQLREMRDALPEFDKRKIAATTYLRDELHMNDKAIDNLLGDVSMVKHFSGLQEKSKAAVTAKTKEVKKAPESLGRPGSEMPTPEKGESYEEVFAKWQKNPNDQKAFEKLMAAKGLL